MANWEFYDNDEDLEPTDSDKEPSFSFYEFKKWLSKQKHSIKKNIEIGSVKEEFKDKMRKRVEEKVKKKLSDKKKKKAN